MSAERTLRVAVLTVSDGVAAGAREDVHQARSSRSGYTSVVTCWPSGINVPDETGPIADVLVRLCDQGRLRPSADNGRDRPYPERCDAGGDQRRARSPRARDR